MSTPEPDELERLREALASLPPESDTVTSVDTGRIFDALHGKLSAAEREAIVDATVDDSDAAEAWRLAVELAPPQPAVTESSRGLPWTWIGIAAVLVLAMGAVWLQFGLRREGQAPIYRSVDTRSIASLLPPGAPLPRQAPVLQWTAIEGARYRVRVLTGNLDPLDEATGLASAEYTLPPSVVSRVPAGSVIFWQVEADVPGEASVVSPTFSSRLQ